MFTLVVPNFQVKYQDIRLTQFSMSDIQLIIDRVVNIIPADALAAYADRSAAGIPKYYMPRNYMGQHCRISACLRV